MKEDDFAELAAGQALNALSPSERAAFEAALAEHREWQERVDRDVATASLLGDAVAAVTPPASVRSDLLARIQTLPQSPSSADEPARVTNPFDTVVSLHHPSTGTVQTASRRRWTRGLFGLAASLVVLVSLGFGAVSLNDWINRPPAVVALQEIESAPDAQSATVEITDGGVATAHWSSSLGRAVLVADDLPRLATDETFELWFVRGDGAVSAGTFSAAGVQTTALLDGAFESGDAIAVTIEAAGGSSTGAPTTDPILVIPTA